MIKVELPGGYATLIDDEDRHLIERYTWHANRCATSVYARATIREGSALRHVHLHRLILDVSPGHLVDHINRDGLDNRRSNLRLASRKQNAANRIVPRSGKFRGVSPSGRQFKASMTIDRKTVYLGLFKSEEDAARAYDAVAFREYGAFAVLNFPVAAAIST